MCCTVTREGRGCPDFGEGGTPDVCRVRVFQAEGTAGAKALWQELGRFEDPGEGSPGHGVRKK